MDTTTGAQALFDYLGRILYEDSPAPPPIDQLPPELHDLCKGLEYLQQAIGEMKQYTADLSLGNLSVEPPPRENLLCANLKNLHANLNHLTWQAQQVAKGDYSQTVSCLGEFSDAFNRMTAQLRERENRLKLDALEEQAHARTMESYNQVLLDLIAQGDEEILVTDQAKPALLYPENAGEVQVPALLEKCLSFHPTPSPDSCRWVWEAEIGNRVYRVITGLMLWQGKNAYAHILRDITQQRRREVRLEAEAHQDALTGIGNRFYFLERLELALESGECCQLCYCDLDHLKYANDRFGHSEGDWYIRRFVGIVEASIRREDIFARIGGDEFCLLLRGCDGDTARRKIQEMQRVLTADTTRDYPKSFSCGITEIPANHPPLTAEEVLHRADTKMYRQKQRHKADYVGKL